MSALPPENGHVQCSSDVRFVPIAHISGPTDRNVNGSLFCAQLGAKSILRSIRSGIQIVFVNRRDPHDKTLGIPPGMWPDV